MKFAFNLLLPTMFFAVQSYGNFGFKFDGTLDKEAIGKAYFESEFPRIIPPLETYRQIARNVTHEDSIFVMKYLSVVYAADAATKKKAEYYMVQLLRLAPSIELVDLYVSDSIQAQFQRVKAAFLKDQQYIRGYDELRYSPIRRPPDAPGTLRSWLRLVQAARAAG